ncbi:MAG: long-chain fatty acid--CoA ligase [Candidatus Marinimicrobia bacterium CG08_land_8_20_14_0_20_45_22]|nr:MAG: long-chain fatty acid--CoA ligase [Candidatus Marinimicrobia bacterium CG08_land_8_20_14_0_20_45_22]
MFINNSEKTAIVWRDLRVSYRDLLSHIHFFASLFHDKKSGKVAIFSPNRPEWVYVFYAAWKNHCIAVPIDYLSSPDEVAYILNDCQPEVVFCAAETRDVLNQALEKVSHEVRVFVFEEQRYDLADYSPEEIDPLEMSETAAIIYTSGTTGSPKGVMLSFDNMLANIHAVSKEIPIFTPDRTVLALLPFHHVFPLLGSLIAPLYVGAKIAFSPSMVSQDIITTLNQNGVGIIIGVPRLYAAIRAGVMEKVNKSFAARTMFKLAKLVHSRAFSKTIFKKVHQGFGGKIEYLVSGGAKLDEDVAKDFKTLGFEMLEGFGMTEAAPMITFTRPGHWKIGSAGQPMPSCEVKILDGEIVARGRNIMQGYYHRPEETNEVLWEGWLHTGDLGNISRKGFVYITGRIKEIIVLSNGENINPEEIEKKIYGLSDLVAEVGVFAKNDTLMACILPDFKKMSDRGIVAIDELFRWEVIDKYNRGVASSKKITKFFLVKEELPKTRLGKVQRYKLALQADFGYKRREEHQAEPDYEEYHVIHDYLSEQTKEAVHPDDHFEIDLVLDSLDKISFQTFLQTTFGINIKEDILLNYPTVEKLSQYMKEKKNKLTVEAVKWAEIFREKVDLKLPRSWFTQCLLKDMSKFLFKLYFRFKGEGTENIPNGPFIIASNHQSFIDGLFVAAFLKRKVFKNTYFYAKEKHVRNRFVRAFANRNNVIILDINRDLKQSLQKLAAVLRDGKNIIIFPEGTRTHTGKLREFKKSFAILSWELNVPVVPVSIKGAFEALPSGSLFPRPWKKIRVKFHRPIYPGNLDYESLSNAVYNQLAAEIG